MSTNDATRKRVQSSVADASLGQKDPNKGKKGSCGWKKLNRLFAPSLDQCCAPSRIRSARLGKQSLEKKKSEKRGSDLDLTSKFWPGSDTEVRAEIAHVMTWVWGAADSARSILRSNWKRISQKISPIWGSMLWFKNILAKKCKKLLKIVPFYANVEHNVGFTENADFR
jgi:hypothetical protein